MKIGRYSLAVGLILAMSVAAGQIAAAAPSTTLDIHFDGYCDGMHLNVPSIGVGATGTVDGDHTGCVTGGFEGSFAGAAHITTEYGGLVEPLLHFVIFTNRTWTIYGISGDLETLVNSGTWSPGPPSGTGPAAGLVHRAKLVSAPTTTLDIHFDGYCDGLHINTPSIGLGTTGTVDGDHTGCITGGFVGTFARGARISTDYGGFAPTLFHIVINTNRTWTIYGISGDLQTIINSGTWSPGPPSGGGPAAAAG